jgi:tetratricopeptide (TPR) repeat protein
MAEEESEEDKRLRNRLEEKEKEARGLLEKGNLEKALKAMEELKEGYEKAPEHFGYPSKLLYSYRINWLLLPSATGLAKGNATPYELSEYISQLGDALADLFRIAKEKGISCWPRPGLWKSLQEPKEIEKDMEAYKQFLQNNNAVKIARELTTLSETLDLEMTSFPIDNLLDIWEKFGQEELYKAMRVTAEYKGKKAHDMPYHLSIIAEKSESFDKALELIERCDEIGEEAAEGLVYVLYNNPKSFGKVLELMEKYGEAGGEAAKELGRMAYKTETPEGFNRILELMGSDKAIELIGRLGKAGRKIVSTLRWTTTDKPLFFYEVVKMMGQDRVVEVVKEFGESAGDVAYWLTILAKDNPKVFDKAVELMGQDRVADVVGKYGEVKGAIAGKLTWLAGHNPKKFDKAVKLMGQDKVVEVVKGFGEGAEHVIGTLMSTAEYRPDDFDKELEEYRSRPKAKKK